MRAGARVVVSQRGSLWWYTCISVLLVSLSACDTGTIFKSAGALKTNAQKSLEEKNYTYAATAATALITKQPDGYEGYFLLAQAQAQLGDRNASVSALEHAIKHGLQDDNQIAKNALLDPIRAMPVYRSLMAENFPNHRGPDPDGVSIHQDGNSQEVRAGDVVIKINQN